MDIASVGGELLALEEEGACDAFIYDHKPGKTPKNTRMSEVA